MNNPFSAWSYASRVFQDHESKSEIHKTAILGKHNFLDTPENKQKYIDLTTIHGKILDQTVSENGAKPFSMWQSFLLTNFYARSIVYNALETLLYKKLKWAWHSGRGPYS